MKSTEGRPARVLALGCHPDDIEFMMAGTFLLLGERGAELHYCNVANGCYGSNEHTREALVDIRAREGKNAAAYANAVFHPSYADDLHVMYEQPLIRKVASLIRNVKPDILLLPALGDYMEDHMNTARVGVTAAFVRGMGLYQTDPPQPHYDGDIALYHAMPYGLRDALGRSVIPQFYVDISGVMGRKEQMLNMHASQRAWLDNSQGIDSYGEKMKAMAREVGRRSQKFGFAEGWIRHNPLGFSSEDYDPLGTLLKDHINVHMKA